MDVHNQQRGSVKRHAEDAGDEASKRMRAACSNDPERRRLIVSFQVDRAVSFSDPMQPLHVAN